MKKLVLVFAALALSACISMQPSVKGARITDTMLSEFKVGKDTQQTVRAKVGEPTTVESLAGGAQIWRYKYSEVSSTLRITQETTLFEFNTKGVLSNLQREGSQPFGALGSKLGVSGPKMANKTVEEICREGQANLARANKTYKGLGISAEGVATIHADFGSPYLSIDVDSGSTVTVDRYKNIMSLNNKQRVAVTGIIKSISMTFRDKCLIQTESTE